MKPTKNRVFCHDCGKVKMLFESEKAANTFMKFNSEEIAELNGHAPIRSYFCIACNGWHVTSHPEDEKYAVSRTERVINNYKRMKEERMKANELKNEKGNDKEKRKELHEKIMNLFLLTIDIYNSLFSHEMGECVRLMAAFHKSYQETQTISGHEEHKKELKDFYDRVQSRFIDGKSDWEDLNEPDLSELCETVRRFKTKEENLQKCIYNNKVLFEKKINSHEIVLNEIIEEQAKREQMETKIQNESNIKQLFALLNTSINECYVMIDEDNYHHAIEILKSAQEYLEESKSIPLYKKDKLEYEDEIRFLIHRIETGIRS